MKKTASTLILTALFFSAVAETLFVNSANANPYSQLQDVWVQRGEAIPPNGTKPPTLSILSPTNSTAYASNNVTLNFNVNITEIENAISQSDNWLENRLYFYKPLTLNEVYYKTSWQLNRVDLKTSDTFSIDFTNVPEGSRWIEVYAIVEGGIRTSSREIQDFFTAYVYYESFKFACSSMVNFTIDTTPPTATILYLENKTYSSTVPLDFVTNESISQSLMSIDGLQNVTITGNTTLSALTNGAHNVTVFVKDKAGNVGASQTITFTIAESVSTTLIIGSSVAVAAVVAAVGLGLLVHFKKRQGNKNLGAR
jgi:hypothetical protein